MAGAEVNPGDSMPIRLIKPVKPLFPSSRIMCP